MRKTFTSDPTKRSGRHSAGHSGSRSVTAITARLLAILIAGIIAGCGLGGKEYDETVGWSAQKLYDEAKDALNGANYTLAVKYFEKLEARYPYGRYAQQAQLEIAYAYYREGEVAQAVAAADRFIKLHPNHANVDYAYYLKGLANFNDDLGLMGIVSEKILNQDMSERDPKASRESFENFRELVTRFPSSKYAPDAVQRMKHLVNVVALNEVQVARYYMRRGGYVAAANRAQYTLKEYPQTPATEEALFIMIKAYDALEMTDLRDDAARVMTKNFPNSRFFPDSTTAGGDSWWKFW